MTDDLRDQLQTVLGPACMLGRELGGGGMARVFVAHDSVLERDIVVKALPPELAGGMNAERFAREVRLAASLSHPHVVAVLSSGAVGDTAFYTMPYVPGESLRTRIARGDRLSVSEVVSILRDVARALGAAHARGIIHRDVKPDNILLSGGSAAVSDFGIARALAAATLGEQDSSPERTAVGVVLGTPQYLAPEQATADPAADHRMDIYALGCTAYEMLTGEPPFTGGSIAALIAAHVMERPRRLAELRPDVPPALESLVMRCLEKDPALRPATAAEVTRLLDEVPVSREHRGPRLLQIRRGAPGVWLVAAAALLLGAGALWRQVRIADTVDPSIAVLPLQTLAGDSASIYLGAGLAEELTMALREVPGLRVAARSSALRFDAHEISGREAGRQLGVATVLTGTLRRSGERLRVTVELTRTADDQVLWAERFERGMRDVFDLQDEITRDIVSALRVELAEAYPRPARGAADVAAYDAYLRGLYGLRRRGEGLEPAVRHLRESLRRDPGFAPAWGALAMALVQLPAASGIPVDSIRDDAREAARRAIAIDSTLARPHTALALLHRHDWRWPEAEAAFRRAISLDSSSSVALQGYTEMLAAMGRVHEAVSMGRRAYAVDPLSASVVSTYAHTLDLAGRPADAQALHGRALALEPENPVSRTLAAVSQSRAGRHDEALRTLTGAGDLAMGPGWTGIHATLRARAGDAAGARELVQDMERQPHGHAGDYAMVMTAYTALGEHERAEALTRPGGLDARVFTRQELERIRSRAAEP